MRRIFRKIRAWRNRPPMELWAAQVERFIASPPGSDEGLSAEEIAREGQVTFASMSTWAIVCEEVVDTQHSCIYFDRAREELRRRGIGDAEYLEMRRFAWLTAGWLNFEMMLWDWCGLDANDIHRAIDWQYKDGWISAAERDRRREFVMRYERAEN